MNTSPLSEEQAATPRFDLIVRLPDNPDLALLQHTASTQLKLGEDKAARLMTYLDQRGATRIKSDIARDEAERTAQNFVAAGFLVEVKPTLALLDKSISTSDSECPGCQRMMRPTAQRQCPHCLIYLDKIDPEKLRLKQIREEELRKLNARLQREGELDGRQRQEDSERALRNRIRAELEKELGLHNPWQTFFRGRHGLIRASLLAGLLGAAFWGGYRLATHATAVPGLPAAVAQDALSRIMGGGLPAQPLDVTAFEQSPAGAVLQAGTADSLLVPAGADAAPAGGEWQGVADSVAKARGSASAALGEKQNLALALVVALAEAGQVQRANELLARLQATPGYQADSARADGLLASAWMLLQRPSGASQPALEQLAAEAAQLKPHEAAVFNARLASMLAARPEVAPQIWQAWQARAQQSLAALPTGVMRDYVASQLQRWQGQALLGALQVNAAKGRWQEANNLYRQLQQLAANPVPALQLQASQAALAVGKPDTARSYLAQASMQAQKATQAGDQGVLQPLPDHQGNLAMAPLLAGMDAIVVKQNAAMQAPMYGAMANIAAAAGMGEASTLYQQRVAALLTGSEGRDEQILALSVACSTRLARFYQQTRQPAQAEQQLRKAAAVVVPLLPAAPAAG